MVALGGGAVTIDDVREALRRLPHVVWLDAPPRCCSPASQSGRRPLARDEAAFEALYAQRAAAVRRGVDGGGAQRGRERLAWVADKVIAAVAA